MTVSRDATSHLFFPANATEWASFVAGTGVSSTPLALWQMQDSASPLVDSVNAINLTDNGLFQQTVSGQSRLGTGLVDGSSTVAVNSTSNAPDLSTTSCAFLVMLSASTPTTQRSFLGLGPGGTETNNVIVELNTSGELVLTDGTNTTTGTVTHSGIGVIPVLVLHDHTNTRQCVFAGFSPEKLTKTYVLPSSGSHGFWIGDEYKFSFGGDAVWGGALSGSNAELTDAQVTALFGRFTTGYVASIALTPNPVPITGTGTQQLAATATMGDSSTYNATSDTNTTWASSSPGVATVSSTGLVTGVAAGTTTITATYGGVVSVGDVVTVASASTGAPGIGIAIGITIGTSIGIGVGA